MPLQACCLCGVEGEYMGHLWGSTHLRECIECDVLICDGCATECDGPGWHRACRDRVACLERQAEADRVEDPCTP
jgi:hypothetical protein